MTPDHYESLYRNFHWQVPARLNIAQVCMRRWAQGQEARHTAIVEHYGGSQHQRYSFGQLMQEACQLSNLLAAHGLRRGDRVAIVLPQRFETAVAYMACFQMGAVAVPLTQLFGEDALLFRLQDSAAVAAIVDANTSVNLIKVRETATQLRLMVDLGPVQATSVWRGKDVAWQKLASYPKAHECVLTQASDAALLIYTSGTTGNPKGVLVPHRALIGNLTGFVCSQNWFGFDPHAPAVDSQEALPQGSEAVFWSPADWAWTGGLMDALLPALYFGRPIVAYAGRFSPEVAFEILQTYQITHSFLFPTALKAMMKSYPQARSQFKLNLQGLMSAGEAVGETVFAYCQRQLGVTVNEMFGQTEINYVVGNCARFYPACSGSMGRAYPGHRVALIDESGNLSKPNRAGVIEGEVAVHRQDIHGQDDPVFFLGYWHNAKASASKYATGVHEVGWCRTGDMARQDKHGYLWYQGRADDMFKAAGYRIGPGEVENCLIAHPAVANAAVVPKPDVHRGNVVKAFVVLLAGIAPTEALVHELQQYVRGKLAPYEYPKEIEFIGQLPTTTTGKIQRRVLQQLELQRAKARSLPDAP